MSFRFIGKPTPQMDAPKKARGESQFTADILLPNLLVGKILRSPHPHARVLKVDTRRAKRLSGLKAVITGEDVPPTRFGPVVEDQFILARDKVRYFGDEVAAVAAVDEEIAQEALSLIKVDYEILEPIFDPERALDPQAPRVHEKGNLVMRYSFSRGNIEEGFAKSSAIREDFFETPRVHQGYLQPHCGVAQVDGQGRITMWSPTQSPFLFRSRAAGALGLPEDQIRVLQTASGGGFGGKQAPLPLYLIAVILARKTGRPVRIENTREEEFFAARPRSPARIWLRMGIGEDGTLMAKETRIIMDCGAYASTGPTIMNTTSMRMDNLYRLRHLKTQADLVYTNHVPVGAFRGYGNPQMAFALESMIDILATSIGMDPLEVRLRNATQEGDTTVHGWEILSCGFTETLRRAAAQSNWEQKRKNKTPCRGMGMAGVIHVSGNKYLGDNDSSAAYLKISSAGNLTLITGEGDIGQGAYTAFRQIVAEEMERPLETIHVLPLDTDIAPRCFGAFASRVTTIGGNAVLEAAKDLKKQILLAASRVYHLALEHLEYREGKVIYPLQPAKEFELREIATKALGLSEGPPLLGRGFYNPPTIQMDPRTKYGNISPAYSFGTHVAEVEVDPETGIVKIVGYWAFHDTGKTLNPLSAVGQVEGGIIQGLGYALMEQIILAEGKPLNGNFRDYPLPTAVDIPPLEVGFIESDDPRGPFGAKGLGEPVLVPCAPAIANAIYDAVGVRLTKIPIRPENIFFKMKERRRKNE